MKKSRMVLRKLTLFLFVLMFVVFNIHTDLQNKEHTVSLRMFAIANGITISKSDESNQDAILQEKYDSALALFDAQEYEKALEAFEDLGEFSNSNARAADSKRKLKAAKYKEAVTLYKAEKFYDAKELFESLDNYEDSHSYLYKCAMKILRIEYQQAKEMYNAGDYKNAYILFESFGNYSDSRERAQESAEKLKEQEQADIELGLYEKAIALKESGDLEGARDTFIEAGDCKDATDQLYSVIKMLALEDAYEKAEGNYINEEYEEAFDMFLLLEDYKNSVKKAALSKEAWCSSIYEQASIMQSNDVNNAYILFRFLDDYKDSTYIADKLQSLTTDQDLYAAADAFAQNGDYVQAKLGFEAIPIYADSQERISQLNKDIQNMQDFKQALFLKEIGEQEQANDIFKKLGEFNNASDLILPVAPRFSTKQLRDDKTSPKSNVFTAPDGTQHRYQIYKGVHTWLEAKAFCEVLGGHLATLTTAEENEFVHNFMLDSGYLTAFFGLSDEEQTGDWEWVTGEPFIYANWHRGEPSYCARERYGMYFYKHTKGTWNDSHFYELAEVDPGCSYICEWDE